MSLADPPLDGDPAAVLASLSHPEVRRQVDRARAGSGPDFDATPLTLALLLHRVAAAFRTAESLQLEAQGLTRTGFTILTVLHRSPGPMTMREIAAAISVQPPNLTAAVRDLERRQLVRRRHADTDRRSRLVETSEHGELLLVPLLRDHFALLGTLSDSVAPAERLLLIGLLDRILTAVTDDAGERGLADRVARAAAHSGWAGPRSPAG
jgi:DNA-binding MarR family transcriptional regulator